MFETNGSELFAVVVAISLAVFFGLMAWVHLASNTVPSWTRTAIGISALVLAISAVLALF